MLRKGKAAVMMLVARVSMLKVVAVVYHTSKRSSKMKMRWKESQRTKRDGG